MSLSHGESWGLHRKGFRGAIVSKMAEQADENEERSSSAEWLAPSNELHSEESLKAIASCPAVEELNRRETRFGALAVMPGLGADTENKTGEWSEKDIGQMSLIVTETPEYRTRSRVWPFSCVGPETACLRLKDSRRLRKSRARG